MKHRPTRRRGGIRRPLGSSEKDSLASKGKTNSLGSTATSQVGSGDDDEDEYPSPGGLLHRPSDGSENDDDEDSVDENGDRVLVAECDDLRTEDGAAESLDYDPAAGENEDDGDLRAGNYGSQGMGKPLTVKPDTYGQPYVPPRPSSGWSYAPLDKAGQLAAGHYGAQKVRPGDSEAGEIEGEEEDAESQGRPTPGDGKKVTASNKGGNYGAPSKRPPRNRRAVDGSAMLAALSGMSQCAGAMAELLKASTLASDSMQAVIAELTDVFTNFDGQSAATAAAEDVALIDHTSDERREFRRMLRGLLAELAR